MPNPSPTPRRQFQVHLVTCVVLMLLTATWLWGNMREPRISSMAKNPELVNATIKANVAT